MSKSSGEPVALSTAERAALDALLSPDQQTGELSTDLATAAKISLDRRRENSRNGAAVLNALHRMAGSWRTVAFVTGIAEHTARRWGAKTPGSDDDDQ